MQNKLKALEQAIFAKRCAGRIDAIREAWAVWVAEEDEKSWWEKLKKWITE